MDTNISNNDINETPNHHNEDDDFQFPDDYDVNEMLDEVPLDQKLKSVTDRYFTPYYKIDAQKPHNDICIRIHSNRICMLTLAPSHPILQSDKTIEQISFKVTEKLDRTANKLSGKGKHGAQPLQENSNICIITCSNGETWPIKCCMSGKLIEVNEALQADPQLIKKPPHRGGYIAIALPNPRVHETMRSKLLDEGQYHEALKNRVRDEEAMVKNIKRAIEDDHSSYAREEKMCKK